MAKPLSRCINWLLQRLLPKTWDRAVHRVATQRGLTDEQVRAKLQQPTTVQLTVTDGDDVECGRAIVAALEKHAARTGYRLR